MLLLKIHTIYLFCKINICLIYMKYEFTLLNFFFFWLLLFKSSTVHLWSVYLDYGVWGYGTLGSKVDSCHQPLEEISIQYCENQIINRIVILY